MNNKVKKSIYFLFAFSKFGDLEFSFGDASSELESITITQVEESLSELPDFRCGFLDDLSANINKRVKKL